MTEYRELLERYARSLNAACRTSAKIGPPDELRHDALIRALSNGNDTERELARVIGPNPDSDIVRDDGVPSAHVLEHWAKAARTRRTGKREGARQWIGAWSQPVASFVSSALRRDNQAARDGQLDLLLDRHGKPIARLDSGKPGIPPILLAEAHENPAILGSIEAHKFIRWAARYVAERHVERADGKGGWLPYIDLKGGEGELAALLGIRDPDGRAAGRLRELLDVLHELHGEYPPGHPRAVRFKLLSVTRRTSRTHATIAFDMAWTPRFQADVIDRFPKDPVARRIVPVLGMPPLWTRRDLWALDASAALEAGAFLRERAEEYTARGSVEVPRLEAERWAHHAGHARRRIGETAERLLNDWTKDGGKHDPDAPALLEHVEGRRFKLGLAYQAEERSILEAGRTSAQQSRRGKASVRHRRRRK